MKFSAKLLVKMNELGVNNEEMRHEMVAAEVSGS